MKPIIRVNAVNLTLLKSLPPQLAITAFGEVSSGGWKNGTLAARHYFVPPADGIWDFDFVATPPTGIAIQVILPITAHTTLTAPPAWLKGIRVHSATNRIVSRMDAKTPKLKINKTPLPENATQRKVSLSMVLDHDVLPGETGVWLEGQFVDGWTFDGKAHVRTYEQFAIAGTLDVRAAARSINEPDIKGAVQLAVVVDDGTPKQLRVDTRDFRGSAEASYNV